MGNKWKIIFYETKDGQCPVQRYLDSVSLKNRAKVVNLIEYLKQVGPNLPRPYADILTDGIHELRVKLTGNQVRILYFFCYKQIIVLTHSFIKNEKEVPVKEIKKAVKAREDFLNRFSINDLEYYGDLS